MAINEAQKGLTPADVTALCTVAQAAWDRAPGKAKSATFEWRGKQYIAMHTSFRLVVHSSDGQQVACRYD
jgi:hypothetical protein